MKVVTLVLLMPELQRQPQHGDRHDFGLAFASFIKTSLDMMINKTKPVDSPS
jgi:hypothetical protein